MKYWLFYIGMLLLFACSDKKQKQSETLAEQKDKTSFTRSSFYFKGDTIPTLHTGDLEWMAENLNIITDESWCYNDQDSNCENGGRLYRWGSAIKSCEKLGEGWRLPTDEEWTNLLVESGGYFDYLTEKSNGNPKQSNEWLGIDGFSGFNAVRNGWRGSNGGYSDRGVVGFYWSATELDDVESWFFIFYPHGGKLTRRAIKKRMGMTCRCVRYKT